MDFLKNHHRHNSSATSHRSISDTDSQIDDFHSPLHADSSMRSDEISSTTSTAIVTVTVDKHHTPFRSPLSKTTKPSPVNSSVVIERVGLGFRVCEMILSLIAFSVMASDKTKGWSGDSFYRYKEYRYLVAVNVIAFTYATFQAIDQTYHLVYEKHIITFSLRTHFDFLIDQILAYLLISSSSSAATRIDDWVLNWGKDEFTKTASASIVMSFLAFLCFSFSSLISGYNLCDQNSI